MNRRQQQVQANEGIIDVNYFDNEEDYVNAVRNAIDQHLNRPRTNAIDPGLVLYARDTHNYCALDMDDRDRLSRIRLEVSRIERNHARLRQIRRFAANVDENEGQISCPICFDEIRQQVAVALIPCGHVFCTICVDGYLVRLPRNERPVCPVCRQYLRRGRTLRLYTTFSTHD